MSDEVIVLHRTLGNSQHWERTCPNRGVRGLAVEIHCDFLAVPRWQVEGEPGYLRSWRLWGWGGAKRGAESGFPVTIRLSVARGRQPIYAEDAFDAISLHMRTPYEDRRE